MATSNGNRSGRSRLTTNDAENITSWDEKAAGNPCLKTT